MTITDQEILNEREVAEWLGLSGPTLVRHRRDGTGPTFIRLSTRRVGYRRSAVEAWLTRQEQQSLSQREPRVGAATQPLSEAERAA